jgi:hypothetical protein
MLVVFPSIERIRRIHYARVKGYSLMAVVTRSWCLCLLVARTRGRLAIQYFIQQSILSIWIIFGDAGGDRSLLSARRWSICQRVCVCVRSMRGSRVFFSLPLSVQQRGSLVSYITQPSSASVFVWSLFLCVIFVGVFLFNQHPTILRLQYI